jgi:hypothetical protein
MEGRRDGFFLALCGDEKSRMVCGIHTNNELVESIRET